MSDLVFKKIEKNDEKQLRKLIDKVLDNLENPNFFIKFEEWELESMYDESYALLHGAYDGNKLVGMSQLYVKQDLLKEYIYILGLNDYKVCEFGGNLVLPEYRGRRIMKNLVKVQIELAKQMGFDYIIWMTH